MSAGEAGRTKADWEATTYAKAKAKGERKESFSAFSGREVEPLYTPEDLAGHDADRDLGYPGSAPYTRGVQPTMYRGRLWTMR